MQTQPSQSVVQGAAMAPWEQAAPEEEWSGWDEDGQATAAKAVTTPDSPPLSELVSRVCVFAQLELAGHRLAVDADHVVQALPRPPRLTPLPSRQAALQGVLKLRGQVVPVVDLRHWLQPAAEVAAGLAPSPHIMVLGHEGKVVGIGLDGIRGLLRIPAEQVHAVAHQAEADNFFHSVINLPDSDDLVMVLDPLRLMALTQAWASANATSHASEGTILASAPDSHTQPHALVRLGDVVLAAPADVVREVGHQPPLNRVFGQNPYLRAMTRWRGVDVPVLDPVQALALSLDETPSAGPRLLMVLSQNGRHAAVPVDEVLSVRRFAQTELQSPADTGTPQAHLYAATTTLDGGGPHQGKRVRLLNATALLEWLGMAEMADRSAEASLQTAPDNETHSGDPLQHPEGVQRLQATPSAPSQPTAPESHAYVVFDMGREWAAPVNLLQEVMPFPASFQPATGADPFQLGSCDWRGRTLPVLDLRPPRADGTRPPKEQARLLVVSACQRQAGLVVDDVVALLPANQGTHTRLMMAGREPTHLITVGHASSRKTYEVLDFSRHSFFAET